MEDRGKPPRGRPLDRTPPSKTRPKRRKKTRIAEVSQDHMLPPPHVSKSKRWISVGLVWTAILCAIIVAFWLRSPNVWEHMGGLVDVGADSVADSVSRGELWDQIAFEDVLG
jgi:hypothetical protein